MIRHSTLRNLVFALLMSLPLILPAQSVNEAKPSRPYRLFTTGKQFTIKSPKEIRQLLVWTASGHRIIEQRELNESIYTFRVDVKEKYFFMMVQLSDGKVFTEKIGIP